MEHELGLSHVVGVGASAGGVDGDRRARLSDRFTAAAGDARQRAELLRTALGIQSEAAHALDLHSAEAAE